MPTSQFGNEERACRENIIQPWWFYPRSLRLGNWIRLRGLRVERSARMNICATYKHIITWDKSICSEVTSTRTAQDSVRGTRLTPRCGQLKASFSENTPVYTRRTSAKLGSFTCARQLLHCSPSICVVGEFSVSFLYPYCWWWRCWWRWQC